MTKLSPGARALLEQYREESEIHDRPDEAVLKRIASSIEQRDMPSAQAPRRAASWVAWGAVAAASVAAVWVWTSHTELRVVASRPVSTAVDRIVEPPAREPERAARPVPARVEVAPPPRPEGPSAPLPAAAPQARAPRRAVQSAVPPDDGLQRELELLVRARAAVREGRSAGAKASLRAHAQAFPQGQLAEERDALLVVVRCGDGDAETGRAAFERTHPRSHHLSLIRNACDVKKDDGEVTDEGAGGQ